MVNSVFVPTGIGLTSGYSESRNRQGTKRYRTSHWIPHTLEQSVIQGLEPDMYVVPTREHTHTHIHNNAYTHAFSVNTFKAVSRSPRCVVAITPTPYHIIINFKRKWTGSASITNDVRYLRRGTHWGRTLQCGARWMFANDQLPHH